MANGIDVINMSLSASSGSIALADAVAAAQAAGVLVVSAAGNSGCCNTVGYPAKYAGSMAVGAVDANDVIAGFSSTGPEVDISAPGVAVRAPVPTGTCALCDPSGYKLLNGTSMAAPHVAGVGALLMAQGFTAAQAWQAMTSTARDLGAAGHDPAYGHGRVDAFAAINSTPTILSFASDPVLYLGDTAFILTVKSATGPGSSGAPGTLQVNISTVAIPEPTSVVMLGLGAVAGIAVLRQRRRSA